MSSEMSLIEHLVELRKRIVRALIGVIVGFALAYGFAEEIFAWLMEPLCAALNNSSCQLQALSIAEAFIVYLKTGLVAGLFIAAPWIFYQLWAFVRPGLHANERKYVVPFVVVASAMFVGGAGFGYFVVFPYAFQYFVELAGTQVDVRPSMDAYFSFTSSLLFAFGALFEVPVLTILFHSLGLVSAETLWKTWRYGVLAIFLAAAILTPPDPITMLFLGTPLTVLYLGTLGICSLREHFRK